MAYFPANVYGEYGGSGEKFPYIKKSGDTATGLIIFNGGIQTNVGEATFNGPIVANDEVTISNTGSLYVDGSTEFADDVNITGGQLISSVPVTFNAGLDLNGSTLADVFQVTGNNVTFTGGATALQSLKVYTPGIPNNGFLFQPDPLGNLRIENGIANALLLPSFQFYSKNLSATTIYAAKIDSTGIHTVNRIDTIDEINGTLGIGTANGRTGNINMGINMTGGQISIGQNGVDSATTTINIGSGNGQTGPINIGTGSSSKNISIGNAGTVTISASVNANLNGLTATRIGNLMTTGTINIGRVDSTNSTTSIEIASGSTYTGTINIGTGAGSKPITIGNAANNGTISVGCLTPLYTGTTPTASNIGYKANLSVGSLIATITSPANVNTTAISVPNGVWLVNIVLRISYVSQPSAPTYVRVSLSTVSGTAQDERTIDFNPNTSGANFCNYAVTIANSTATNYWVVASAGGSVIPSVTSLVFNITRIA